MARSKSAGGSGCVGRSLGCACCAQPHVAAFPIQRLAQHGWVPALELTADEFVKLERGCGHAEQCEVEVEGTRLSSELPTSMKLDSVRILRAHAG